MSVREMLTKKYVMGAWKIQNKQSNSSDFINLYIS